ncbi:hypothetical protein C8R44DRAFT_363090 [Mycena epipterygia]|nr:hypothetical protein C8R44DRAFT_363090 [Mycena epipterygia]
MIRLELLALGMVAAAGVREWLTHLHCPLDLSGLSALSIYTNTELLASQNFAPALRTMGFFDPVPYSSKPTLDLSSFSKLEGLRTTVSLRGRGYSPRFLHSHRPIASAKS